MNECIKAFQIVKSNEKGLLFNNRCYDVQSSRAFLKKIESIICVKGRVDDIIWDYLNECLETCKNSHSQGENNCHCYKSL